MMFRKIALIALSTLCISCSSGELSTTEDFNFDWQFRMGEMDSNFYNVPTHSKGAWQNVDIPHDWSIQSGYTQENTAGSNGFLPGGVGWYSKEFSLPNSYKGKNVFIRFEGVYNNAQVWINGTDLGNFPNGYLDFEYDLTPYIKSSNNIITVRVDRRSYADSRWYVGAGIYRPVHLIARGDIYIPTHAQQISTSNITKQRADISIKTTIQNSSPKEQDLTLNYKILKGKKVVAHTSSQLTVKGNSQCLETQNVAINTPQLWNLNAPEQYQLQTTILCGEDILEQRNEMFGVRSAIFDPDKGFLLNGEPVKIKGVNIHHDLGCLGVALYDKALYRRLNSLKKLGVNAIRTAHNPHSESLLAMCDTMGLLVMNEFIDEWKAVKDKWIIQRSKSGIADSLQCGYPKHFDKWAERDIKAFVQRDFNHPSIILWSIGNEIEWSYSYYYASVANTSAYEGLVFDNSYTKNLDAIKKRFLELSGGEDQLAKSAQDLSRWIKEVDKTRPVTSGVAIPTVARISGYIDALDVIGYNYKDTAYENDHKIHHDKSIIGSENMGQYFEWKAVLDKPYIPGIFIWTGVDYIGENGPWPAKGGTYSLFDFACFKCSRGEFFETLWNDTPKTHIVTTPASISEFKLQDDGTFKTQFRKDPLRKWQWFETFDKWSYSQGEQIVVQVYTNAPKVELLLNGKSLGVKNRADFPTENIILWQIPYSEGELTAIGLDENNTTLSQHTLTSTGELSQLYATCDSETIISNGRDLAHIEIELQDIRGTRICDSEQEITITLDPQTKILGVDNGSDKFVGDHLSNKIVTNQGRALVIIQPHRGAQGKSKVTLSTPNGVKRSITIDYIPSV